MPSKTITNYNCAICKSFDENTSGSGPCQLSHIKNHCKSNHHKKNCEIFKLNLQMKTLDDILIDYPEYLDDVDKFENKLHLIETIIFDRSMVKNVSKKVEEVNTIECQKYKPSNKVVWELSEYVDENENYKQIKSNLESLIKQCHNVLYSSSIVGQKAQNDIMRLLCIKILQYQFNDETSELWDRCNTVKAKRNISDNNFKKYKSFCKDLTELYKSNNGILTEWKGFVNKFLTHVFPSIYYEDDSKFNCIDEATLHQLIDKIESIEINDAFVDSFSTTCGDIHESFRCYSGGKGAKELGQYFTPRQLIHLIFHGLNLNKYLDNIENPSIYDPCMGTAGFLTRLFNLGNINPENIYGCETELDTIKFGEMSLFLTTKGNKQNIVKCNSLSENPFIINTKVDAIVTNPPFGTKMNYKSLKETFEKTFPDSSVKFKDIYPLEVNNGACLFVQHCVYMLNDGGVCAIVLPDGELFEGNSKWSKNYRKWLCENVNIHTILKCPGGTFDHAGVKTNVVVFTKNGPTQNIKYIETTKECEKINELITITKDDLEKTQYSLDINEYIEEKNIYDYPTIEFEKVFTIIQGKIQSSKTNKDENGTLLLTGAKYSNMFNIKEKDTSHSYVEGNNVFMCCGGNGDSVPIRYYEGKCFYSCLMGLCKITNEYENKINPKFYYYYFTQIQPILEEKYQTGSCNKRLNIQKLNKLKIPLPSLEIQEKIVEELSMIETNIESIETRIEQLKEEKERFKKYSRKSEIKELLKDAEIKKLNEVMNVTGGKGENDRSKVETDEYNVPYYDSNGITSYVKNSLYDGEYIITARKMSIGSVHFVKGKYYSSDNTINITSMDSDTTLNTYFYYWLKFNNGILINMSSGIKPGIRMGEVRLLKIPVPSPEIQEKCIQIYQEKEKFIQSIDDKIESEKKYIEELQQLSKDIIHNYC